MKALIRRYPSAFGAILLAGCICGAYLLCMGGGLVLQWLLEQMKGGEVRFGGEGVSSAFERLFLIPVYGMVMNYVTIVLFGIIYFLCKVVYGCFAGIFTELKSLSQTLGAWLVRKTKAS
jgi:hypothetical protein